MNRCSICGLPLYSDYGNNAQPINDGICCNKCNEIVVARRMNDLSYELHKKEENKDGIKESRSSKRGC